MIGNFFLKLLTLIITVIDSGNKFKIVKFFKLKFKKDYICVFDIGAHKGETIDLFCKNFNVSKILSFEPNRNLFQILSSKKKYQSDKIKLFNIGFGKKSGTVELKIFNDTSSSTINDLNENTQYFKRKKKFMSFFLNNEKFLKEKQKVKIENFSEFILKQEINKIDILKIDTEGYEYNIFQGIREDDFKKIKYIYFEHHYDLMINKGYKFSDVKKLLEKYNFKQKYKLRMKLRKSFEYIYENSK